MTRSNRKRLRPLRTWLYGKPRLVVPVPVIGGDRCNRPPLSLEDQLTQSFLWGPEVEGRVGLHLGPGPSDSEWAQWYKACKDGHVTYDATAARERLLSLTHQQSDSSRPTKFSVEPTIAPNRQRQSRLRPRNAPNDTN